MLDITPFIANFGEGGPWEGGVADIVTVTLLAIMAIGLFIIWSCEDSKKSKEKKDGRLC